MIVAASPTVSASAGLSAWFRRCHPALRAYVLSLAFWMPLSLLVGIQTYILDSQANDRVEFSSVLLVYAVRYFTVALLAPPLFFAVTRYPMSIGGIRRLVAYAFGYVAFTCTFAVIRWVLLPPFMEDTKSWGPRSLWTLVELAYSRALAEFWVGSEAFHLD
jgi:hypothetical protein